MASNRFEHSARRAGALALTAMLAGVTPAMAEYPGEIWSVDAVEVRGASAGVSGSAIRSGLRSANEIYFFGSRAAVLRAEVSGGADPALRLVLVERGSGNRIARSRAMALPADADGIRASALAWMEGLTCASAGCAAAPEAEPAVQLASVPQQGGRAAKARLRVTPETAARGQTELDHHGVPIPRSRPVTTATSGRKGRARLNALGASSRSLETAAYSLQIAWAIPSEVSALTYSDSDPLVLETSVNRLATPQEVPRRTFRVPIVDKREPTMLERFFNRLAGLLSGTPRETVGVVNVTVANAPESVGTAETAADPIRLAAVGPATQVDPVQSDAVAAVPEPQVAAKPAVTAVTAVSQPQPRSAWTRAPDSSALINPIQPTPVAVASVGPDTVETSQLRRPVREAFAPRTSGALLQSVPLALTQPARPVTRAQPQRAPVSRTGLTVRLDPSVLGLQRMVRRNSAASRRSAGRVGSVPGAQPGGDVALLARVLGERGYEMDPARYSRFEQVYWSGQGESGFVLTLPNRIPADFVLVSGPNASVVASVRRRDGVARASAGIAETLALRPQEWTKLRIVALRETRTAVGTVTGRKGRSLIH